MPLKITQVDAFTSRAFAGNPAAVCLLPEARDAAWMQTIAREMNLSETAFLVHRDNGFDLRWFTPAIEVDLCGHATLASAHVLWESGTLESSAMARFHTRSGLLTAERRGAWIEMVFPALPEVPAEAPEGFAQALGAKPVYFGRSRFDALAELTSEEEVQHLTPDFGRLGQLPVRGIMVTAKSARPERDFVSRFFAPAAGVPEDPVTGSAHCCLAPYWSRKLGKRELVAHQISPRGGELRLRAEGDRVVLGGQAVTVLQGELLV
ncbi:MAG: PhzF family phenazine biosynthesis protein [Candidatus Eiseniibacteriota bacterium]